MRQFQLRTYHLISEQAALDYLPHWIRHIESLRSFRVETHGFFSSPEEPKAIVVLISFDPDADPAKVTEDYMRSAVFHNDMAGFDVKQITKVDTLSLFPGMGSPLS